MTRNGVGLCCVGLALLLGVSFPAAADNPWPGAKPSAPSSGISVSALGAGTSFTYGPITFSEPEFVLGAVVNGLTVNTLNGQAIPALTFGFTIGGVGSADCTIDGGPGTITYVQPPNIEGSALGVLTINFGTDVNMVTFGFAQSCSPPTPGVAVTAFDSGGNPVASGASVGANTGSGFGENRFLMHSVTAFRSIAVSFPTPGSCARFALDNLAYGQVPTIPVAGKIGLVLFGAILLVAAVLALWYRH